jgi:hypothetical protein
MTVGSPKVKLDIQTGVAFRLPAERAALVEAVAEAAADFKNETNWIERKSGFPLDKPVGGFLIGKAVLGFANREPSRAATTCEGTVPDRRRRAGQCDWR